MSVQAIQLALPSIQVDLDILNVDLQWLVRSFFRRGEEGKADWEGDTQISSYSVAFGGLLLLFGRLADIVRLPSFSLPLR
jgi:hypothetical protein